MSNEIIPDVIKSASEALQSNLPATTAQTDGVLSTVVGFFNNVVLYPVKHANISFRYKLEAFEDDLKKKAAEIPEGKMQIPPTMIAGPTLEALKYTYDEESLREMYENLLVSAMNTEKVGYTHPSFVDAIKQMNQLDALVFSQIVKYNNRMKCANIVFVLKGTTNIYSNGMPDYFVEELAELSDPFLVSASIQNLKRLGLVNVYDAGLRAGGYDCFKQNDYVMSRAKLFESFGKEIEIRVDERAVDVTNYGSRFAKVCL